MMPKLLPELAGRVGWQITEGGKFLWPCYGDSAWNITFAGRKGDWSMHVVFDTQSTELREITGYGGVFSLMHDQPWRWICPLHEDAYNQECRDRGIQPSQAWDNVHYVDIRPDQVDSMLAMITEDEKNG